jgi:signal transduction histidine kinase
LRLKRQLLIASLLMLLIPWAGLQFVLELDAALRDQAATQLTNQADRLGQILELTATAPKAADKNLIYARNLEQPLNLDGYGDDWPQGDTSTDGWQLAVDTNYLYLLVRVSNPTTRYFDPGRPARAHDHLRLYWRENGKQHERHIRTPAPGQVAGWRPGRNPRTDYNVSGVWQATGAGYQLEVRLPRPAPGSAFGFSIHRAASVNSANSESGEEPPVTGPGTPPDLPRLVTRQPPLEKQLSAGLLPGQRALVLDPDGWILAQQALTAPDGRPAFDSLGAMEIIEQISLNGLRALVQFFQPEPVRLPAISERLKPSELPPTGMVRHDQRPAQLMVHRPLAGGQHLVLEQSLAQLLALSGDTLGAVITRSVFLIVALILALLGYASWLSWRITRLQKAVRGSIDNDGRVLGPMPASAAGDELGQLSRQFSRMVDNLQSYTRYLESFANRLSHELRTPVAVVRSSLDNLARKNAGDDQQIYLDRAHKAIDRLSHILQGMSEAARLEQSFDNADHEAFDLAEVVSEVTGAYQALSPDHRITYRGPDSGVTVQGSPEHIVQLLDKLVDNARDFTPAGGKIELSVRPLDDGVALNVFNEGRSLPTDLASELFSPFVSLRDGPGQGHLGQGLLIVRLIAEHHRGRVEASNSTDRTGVIFRVWLPRK